MSRNQLAVLRAARARKAEAHDDLLAARIAAGEREPAAAAWRWGPPVLAAVALVLAASAIWWAAWGPGGPSDRFSDDDYVRAATTRVELLLSADPDDPDRGRRILDGATGEFADEFAQSADAFTTYVARTGVRGEGRVEAAVFAERDGDAAAVLMVATVTVDGPDEPDGPDGAAAPKQVRLRTVVAPDGGVLKLAGVELLP